MLSRAIPLVLLPLLFPVATTLNASNHTSGQYTVAFRPGGEQGLEDQFSVFHRDEPNRALWATDANSTYLAAVQNDEEIYQNGGIFEILESEGIYCADARIESVSERPETGGHTAVVVTGNFCGVCPYTMQFAAADVAGSSFQHLTLSIHIPDCSNHFNSVMLQWSSDLDESFYGFGHQYTQVNMKGHSLPVFLREKGVGRGLEPITAFMDGFNRFSGGSWDTTYTHVPFYVTSAMRSFVLESPEYAIFDMTQQHLVNLQLISPDLHARIIYGQKQSEISLKIFQLNCPCTVWCESIGQSYLDILSSHSAYIGRMMPLPDWVSTGAILALQGGSDAVMSTLDDVKEVMGELSDVAAVWLQDWTGQRNFSQKGQLKRVGLWWNWEVKKFRDSYGLS